MNKPLRLILVAAFLLVVIVVLLVSCDNGGTVVFDVDTPPETTAEIIPTGKFYARCSEPEANQFSIQFVGVVPTCYVDYVGFEANKLYADGTRGSVTAIKLRTLHEEITDSNRGTTLTSENFGVEDGYLFQRVLENIPTTIEDLAYEVAAYYVIGDKKIYTAKQTFYIQEFLEEHILSNPNPFEVQEESELIDVQKWVKYTMDSETFQNEIEPEDGASISDTYYLGTSAPDSHGKVKMYLCYAIPSSMNTTVGIRYNFTETEGEYAGVSTQVRRVRTSTLYKKVISETQTLTVSDFGLDDGYLAVIGFSDDLNTVLRQSYTFNLVAYYSRNAREYTVVYAEHSFVDLIDACVMTLYNIPLDTYTFMPTNYSRWMDFSAACGNASGDGMFKIRVSQAINVNGELKFALQVASAIPTRFAEKFIFVFSAYDENGDPIVSVDQNGKETLVEIREISVTALYSSIFGNNNSSITAQDFGLERGYIASMLLNNIDLESDTAAIRISAYYRVDTIDNAGDDAENREEIVEKEHTKIEVASLIFPLEELAAHVEIVP